MAANGSRSPIDSPVPASMFAPEPNSPGAAGAAAAAARLHDGFDSDCSEDGEALNGEPELDLTSKVGPGAGGSAKWDPAARGLCGGLSRLLDDGGGGRDEPTYLPVRAARRLSGDGRPPRPRPAPPPPSFSRWCPPASRRRLRGRSLPLGSATWNSGARRRQRPTRCRLFRDREGPSLWTVHGSRGSEVAWAGGAEAREGRVIRGGAERRSWCRDRKQKVVAQSGRRMSELCLLYTSTQNKIEIWARPMISPSWEWNYNLYEWNNEGRFK